jgi:hypothetical protein
MKTLYLNAQRELSVTLDGPSLLVHVGGDAARRYPFARLSRVVTRGEVKLSFPALCQLGTAGIPVLALSATDEPQGYFLPYKFRTARTQERLEDFLSRPDWAGCLGDWIRSVGRREILAAARMLGTGLRDPRPEAAARDLRAAATARIPSERFEGFLRSFQPLAASRVAKRLCEEGLDLERLPARRPDFDLIGVFVSLLAWRYFADLAGAAHFFRPPEGEGPPAFHECAAAWERLAEREDRRIGLLADEFFFWLGGAT